ncbi:MAG: Maf-like protein [Rhizobiaceae bacterium]|nr:Maf-like protein [Rhizobiaceae bacterium]
MRQEIILASASPFRARMLEDAGIEFTVERPTVDERAVEEAVAGAGLRPDDLAQILAEAKAVDVSQNHPGAFVIGCDQTLSLGEELMHKPADMEEARRRLLKLSGKTHHLNSAVVIAQDGEAIWRHVSVASLTMRDLDPGFIGRHLSAVGDAALSSVGAYQVEGRGIQLFEKIEGDHFTIVGLPLMPLLAKLRELGAIDG